MISNGLSAVPQLETPKLETPQMEGLGNSRGDGFAKMVAQALAGVNETVSNAETKARELAEGKAGMVETVLALNRADIELRFAVEMRNRVLEAYNQVIRLSV